MLEPRLRALLARCVGDFELDLGGLTVLTEAASGAYLATPILASLAGADRVHAVTADSPFGRKEDVRDGTLAAAAEAGVADRIEVHYGKPASAIREADIVTNTGFVRPIDEAMIRELKPTAVVPLMWETWEYRASDLDLDACRRKGILVLGTDESKPPHAMYPYAGFVAMKLLFELGLEGYRTRVLLLGGQAGLGRSIWRHFTQLDMEVSWFSDTEAESSPYAELPAYFAAHGGDFDVILVAEHERDVRLLGEGGLLSYDEIREANPATRIGVIAGDVDRAGLEASGLRYFPRELRGFGFMSYQAYSLGPLPVLDLYAAGLKVGEAMARARLEGMSLEDATEYALRHSPAMPFPARTEVQ